MKKKILFTVIACLMMVGSVSAATRPVILLSHNGTVTLFDNNKLADAISTAVEGDTLFLSEGAFGGNVTIDKAISIIGTGQKTQIGGDITIDFISDTPLNSRMLDALKIKGSVRIQKSPSNLIIRKCWASNDFWFFEEANDSYLDRCYAHYLTPSNFSNTVNLNNCIFKQIGSDDTDVRGFSNDFHFVNCKIGYVGASIMGTFINSVVHYAERLENSTLINCLCDIEGAPASSTTENCYIGIIDLNSENDGEDYFPNFNYESDQYEGLGFLGTDGTIVGAYGGSTPFSLIPSLPHVNESTLEMSADKKTLNVSVSISTNE